MLVAPKPVFCLASPWQRLVGTQELYSQPRGCPSSPTWSSWVQTVKTASRGIWMLSSSVCNSLRLVGNEPFGQRPNISFEAACWSMYWYTLISYYWPPGTINTAWILDHFMISFCEVEYISVLSRSYIVTVFLSVYCFVYPLKITVNISASGKFL